MTYPMCSCAGTLYHHVVIKDEQRFWKRILIVDDNEDITLTFKAGIEDSNNHKDGNRGIEVHTYNNPVTALSEFKPNFYDLLLVDIKMPNMNGLHTLQLCKAYTTCSAKILYSRYKEFHLLDVQGRWSHQMGRTQIRNTGSTLYCGMLYSPSINNNIRIAVKSNRLLDNA